MKSFPPIPLLLRVQKKLYSLNWGRKFTFFGKQYEKGRKKFAYTSTIFLCPPPPRKGFFLEIKTPATSYLGVCHLVPEIVQIKPNLLEILFSRLKVLRQQGLRIFCNSFNIRGQTENRKSFQVRDLYFLVIPLHTTPSLRQSINQPINQPINQSIRVKKGYPKIEDSSVMKK